MGPNPTTRSPPPEPGFGVRCGTTRNNNHPITTFILFCYFYSYLFSLLFNYMCMHATHFIVNPPLVMPCTTKDRLANIFYPPTFDPSQFIDNRTDISSATRCCLMLAPHTTLLAADRHGPSASPRGSREGLYTYLLVGKVR
jgi:hypothetical protein